MKFKQFKSRKYYCTWVSTRRIKNCRIFIYRSPILKLYHFVVEYCSIIIYTSLDDNLRFNNFELCSKSAELWIKTNIK